MVIHDVDWYLQSVHVGDYGAFILCNAVTKTTQTTSPLGIYPH